MRLILTLLLPFAFVAIGVHLVWGMLVSVFVFPLLGERARDAMIQAWSKMLLAVLGIRVVSRVAPGGDDCHPDEAATRSGASPDGGEDGASEEPRFGAGSGGGCGSLLLLNHISWVDVFVLASVLPARFVSKSEVAHWPIFGRLAAAVGTLFVERGRRHAVAAVNHLVAHRLQSGQCIAIFPEGTTTEGDRVLRFHANLVQPALDVGASVRPVALRYLQDGQVSLAAAYAGDTTMGQSVLAILLAPRLTVEVIWLPPVDTTDLRRQEVGARARATIVQALGLPDHDAPAFDPTASDHDEVASHAQ